MKIKKILIVFLCLAFTSLLFAGCGENRIMFIKSTILNVQGDYVERVYGDTEGLCNFVVYAVYSNKDTEEITNECNKNIITPTGAEISFEQYEQKVNNGTLEVGTWTIEFTYKDYFDECIVIINKPENQKEYAIELNCTVDGFIGELNKIPYGTKISGIEIKSYCNEQVLDNSYLIETYILSQDVNYTDELVPNIDILDDFSSPETLNPGVYYLTALFSDGEYANKFAKFTKIEVVKAQTYVDSSELKLYWSFTCDSPYENVTFEQMYTSIQYDGLKIVLCSDGILENNNEQSSYNKKTEEIIINNLSLLGDFELCQEENSFNASNDYQDLILKFIPNSQNEQYYSESEAFNAKIMIKKAIVDIPLVKCTCCDSNHIFSPKANHSLEIYSPFTGLYTITTNGKSNYQDAFSYNEYYSDQAGTLKVTFNLIYKNNYQFNNYTASGGTNYSCILDISNTILDVSLNIQKGDLSNYEFSITTTNGQEFKLNNNSIDLKLTNLIDGQQYLDNSFSWEILPIGSSVNNTISLASGNIADYTEKSDDTRYKTLTITEITSSASEYNYVTVAIKISCSASTNWNAYGKTFLLTIAKWFLSYITKKTSQLWSAPILTRGFLIKLLSLLK